MLRNSVLWRLAWKEYRSLRGFWLAIVVAGLVFQIWYGIVDRHPDAGGYYFVAVSLSILYGLGCGAVAFAAEHEDGTADLLRFMAVSPAALLFTKLVLAVASTTAIYVVLACNSWFLSGESAPTLTMSLFNLKRTSVDGLYWSILAVVFLLWGYFFSTLTRNVLGAACLATAMVVVLFWIASAVVDQGVSPIGQPRPWVMNSLGIAVAGLLLPANYWLVRRWLLEPAVVQWPQWLRNMSIEWVAHRHSARQATSPLEPHGLLMALVWQEGKVAAKTVAAFALVVGLLLALGWAARWETQLRFNPMCVVLLLLTPALMGLFSFRGEQRNRRFRFLAEHGIPPAAVWAAKHSVWIPIMVTAMLLIVLSAPIGVTTGSYWQAIENLRKDVCSVPSRGYYGLQGERESWLRLALFAFLAYGSGQLASMLVRRTLGALVPTLLLYAGLIWWNEKTSELCVPLVWSVIPVPLVFLATTLVRSRGWMLERNSRRDWLPAATTLLLPSALIVVAVPFYRVYQIPDVDPGISQRGVQRVPLASPQDSAGVYQQAMYELTEPETPFADWFARRWDPSRKTSELVSPAESKWLDENRHALALARQAANQPVNSFPPINGIPGLRRVELLATLMLLNARQHEANGRWDESVACFGQLLNLAAHLNQGGPDELTLALSQKTLCGVHNEVVQWALHPDQTPQRIRQAIRVLEQRPNPTKAWSDWVKFTHAAEREMWNRLTIHQDWPWEKRRKLRLLNWRTAEMLRVLETIPYHVRQPGETATDGTDVILASSFFANIRQCDPHTAMDANWRLAQRIWPETYCRAQLVTAALIGWRLEHGRLPERLEELVGTYLDEMPADPWSGQMFGYEPHGFATSVQFFRISVLGYETQLVVDPNVPVLFSVGETQRQPDPIDAATAVRLKYARSNSISQPPIQLQNNGWYEVKALSVFPIPGTNQISQ